MSWAADGGVLSVRKIRLSGGKTPIVQEDAVHRRGVALAAQVAGLPADPQASTIGLGAELRSGTDVGVAFFAR